MEDNNQRPPNLGPDRDPEHDENPNAFFSGRGIWLLLLLFLGVFLAVNYFQYPAGQKIPYSELKQKVKEGKVEKIKISDQWITAHPTEQALEKAKKKSKNDGMEVWRAVRVENDDSFVQLLDKQGIEYSREYQTGCEGSYFWLWVAPLIIVFLLWGFFMRRLSGLGGRSNPAMNFGKTSAEVHLEEGTGVTFEDVAGCKEAKEELQEIIEFLKKPD
ncbi:MAG: ATP-dependent metallopeptidase FtsH/Yme1/Tma family protein, partial [Bradymonadaceae bacterium]